jgi:hypothetical protein
MFGLDGCQYFAAFVQVGEGMAMDAVRHLLQDCEVSHRLTGLPTSWRCTATLTGRCNAVDRSAALQWQPDAAGCRSKPSCACI